MNENFPETLSTRFHDRGGQFLTRAGKSRSGAFFAAFLALFLMAMTVSNDAYSVCSVTISGSSVVCVGDVTTYYVTDPVGDGSYNWTISNTYGTVLGSGITPSGTPYLSVKWTSAASGVQAWVRASISGGTCNGTISAQYFVTVYAIPSTYTFTYPAANFVYPSDAATAAFYCHEGNGVDLYVNGGDLGTIYQLRRISDDFVEQSYTVTTAGAFYFNDVKVQSYTATASSSTTYYVVALNPTLCQNQMVGTVEVVKFEKVTGGTIATTSPSTIGVCSDAPVFTSTTDGAGGYNTIAYIWQNNIDGGGWNDIPSETSSTLTSVALTTPGTYAFRRLTYNDNSDACVTSGSAVASNSITITVDVAPVSNAGSDQTIGECASETATLDGTGSTGTTLNYSWSPATYLSSTTVSQPTFGPAPDGTYALTLTVTDAYSCTATDVVSVTVSPAPTANAGSDDQVGTCSTPSLSGASSTGTSLSYSWTPITYLASYTTSAPVFGPAPAATYTITLVVTDTYGCTASDDVEITVDPSPVADAGTGGVIGECASQTQNLSGSGSTGTTLSYSWSPDTYLSSSTVTSPTFGPAPDGTYNLTLTVTDAYSCTATDVVSVTVSPAPVANAGSDVNIGVCETEVLSGTSSTGTSLSYNWTPITYLASYTTSTPTFGTAPTGPYTLTLVVTDTYGCTNSDDVVVTVDPAPSADAGTGGTIGECASETFALNGSLSSGTSIGYAWAPGTYLSSTTVTSPTFGPAPDGSYTLSLVVTDSYGCTSGDQVVVVVDPAPTIDAGTGGTIGACGNTLPLDATATGTATLTYGWTGTGTIGTDYTLSSTSIEDPIFTSSITGTYTLTILLTDNYGCTASDDVVVEVEGPTADAGAGTTMGYCGKTYNLNSTSGGTSISISWSGYSPNSLSPNNADDPTFTSTTPGTYTLTLTVVDTYGCTATDDVTITVDQIPVVNAGVDGLIGACTAANSYQFAASYTGTTPSFTWTGSDVTKLDFTNIEDPLFSAGTAATTYTYTVTMVDTYGCTATTDNMQVQVEALPTVDLVASYSIGECATANSYTLSPTATGNQVCLDPLGYSWTGSYLSSSTVSEPVFSSAPNGSYTITVLVTDAYNCTVSDAMTIVVDQLPTADAGVDLAIGSCNISDDIASLSTGTGISIAWTGYSPNVTLSPDNADDPTVSSTTPGTYELTLTVTDGYGCSVTDAMSLTVDVVPVVNAGSDGLIGECTSANSYTITSSYTGTTPSFAWNGSDNTKLSSTTVSQPVFSGAGDGTYTYTVTMVDTYGCTAATDNLQIQVEAEPTVNLEESYDLGACPTANSVTITPVAVTGNAICALPLTYSWTGSNLSSTTVTTPVFSTSVTNVYTVSVIVTDNYGCTVTDFTEIEVHALPVADAGTDYSSLLCETPAMGGTSTGDGISYNWSPSTYLSSYSATAPTFNSNSAGSVSSPYTIYLTVTDTYGCTDEDNVTITVIANPYISGEDTVFAYSNTAVYTVTPLTTNGSNSFNWSISSASASSALSTCTPTFGAGPSATIYVSVTSTLCPSTTMTSDTDVVVMPNIMKGQVKYYNALESPMPSPFNSNYNGMTVPDYFYVQLYDVTEAPTTVTLLETKRVEATWVEDAIDPVNNNPTEYLSYFEFDENFNPSLDYQIRVWDGGFVSEGDLGNGLGDGTLGQAWTWSHWGGVNATDALMVQQMAAGIDLNSSPYNKYWLGDNPTYGFYGSEVANVNNSSSPVLTALDALLTSRRAVGLINQFPSNKPNFEVAGLFVDETDFNTDNSFSSTITNVVNDGIDFDRAGTAPNYIWSTLAVGHYYANNNPISTTPGDLFLNIYYNAVGDVNASYVPTYGGFKAQPELILEGEQLVTKGEIVTLPLTLSSEAYLGAVSLGLNYRNDLVEVLAVNYSEDFARIDAQNGKVWIAWADMMGSDFNNQTPVALLTVRILGDVNASSEIFSLNDFTEFAEVNGEVRSDLNLKTTALVTGSNAGTLVVGNYPNPFSSATTISYTLPENGLVSLVLYNDLGQVVNTFVNQTQSAGSHEFVLNSNDLPSAGHYYYKLELRGEKFHSAQSNFTVIK